MNNERTTYPDMAGPSEAYSGPNLDVRPETSSNLPALSQRAEQNLFGNLITAQPGIPKRDRNDLMRRLHALAHMNGERFYYSWKVNDRKNDRKVLVEGPSVKLTNDLAREYGNCSLEVRVVPDPSSAKHHLFYARFADLQTGYSLVLPYRQRTNQNVGGGMDNDRAADMVFQIGSSKARRNVVSNALDTFCHFMLEEAKKGALAWVTNNPDKAADTIDRWMDRHGIALRRIEMVVGRPRSKWVARDTASVIAMLQSVDDGQISGDELFPADDGAGDKDKDPPKPDPKKAAAKTKPAAKPAAKKPAASKKKETGPKEAPTVEQSGSEDSDPPTAPMPDPVSSNEAVDEETGEITEEPDEDGTAPDGEEEDELANLNFS